MDAGCGQQQCCYLPPYVPKYPDVEFGVAMTKRHTRGFRLDDEELDALNRAAEADDRKPAALMSKIVVDWLRAKGWLKKVKK
jgi:hypothetical protein